MTNVSQTAFHDELTVDDSAFAVLASERRRTVLRCLQATNEPVATADLARDVAAREHDTEPRDVPEGAIEQVYVRLHHCHFPKLADEGFLRYDGDRTSVALTNDAESLESTLDLMARLVE